MKLRLHWIDNRVMADPNLKEVDIVTPIVGGDLQDLKALLDFEQLLNKMTASRWHLSVEGLWPKEEVKNGNDA